MDKKLHNNNINLIIKSFRELCDIQEVYFSVTANVDKEGGVVNFELGPSFTYEDKWTVKKLQDIKNQFAKELQKYLIKHKFDGILIKSKYGSWAVNGYDIKLYYSI